MKRNVKKIIATLAIILCAGLTADAQTASSTQTVNLSLTDAVDIIFSGSGTSTGSTVTLNFGTTNDLADGVESTAQQLRVRSNRNFNVAVKTNSTNFTYTGTASPTPTMPVSGILKLQVSSNSTGGTVVSSYNATYGDITTTNQNIITSGSKGGNQLFSIKYKGIPGFDYPGGDYTTTIVYTVTQL